MCFARLVFRDSIYDAASLIRPLQETFGDTKMIGPGNDTNQGSIWERLKVAVTSKEIATSACSLLTTYNKSIHKDEKAYQWAQADGALPKLKVWEA